MHKQRLFYCYKCGGKLFYTKEENPKLKCSECSTISYENPIVGVAGIVLNERKEILLVRRAQNVTYAGLWCIPCGYVEYDEDIKNALKREMLEETSFVVDVGDLFAAHSNFHNPKQHTVGIWYICNILSGVAKAGDDADEIGWFSFKNVPKLAFPTDNIVLSELKEKNFLGE